MGDLSQRSLRQARAEVRSSAAVTAVDAVLAEQAGATPASLSIGQLVALMTQDGARDLAFTGP
jgi:hypothetical protein